MSNSCSHSRNILCKDFKGSIGACGRVKSNFFYIKAIKTKEIHDHCLCLYHICVKRQRSERRDKVNDLICQVKVSRSRFQFEILVLILYKSVLN